MIVIPFLPRFHEPILSGRKTMTCRTHAYGEAGDIVQGPGCNLQFVSVKMVLLGDVARDHYIQEGCESPEEFKAVWKELHPVHGWDPRLGVWLHEFKVVP